MQSWEQVEMKLDLLSGKTWQRTGELTGLLCDRIWRLQHFMLSSHYRIFSPDLAVADAFLEIADNTLPIGGR